MREEQDCNGCEFADHCIAGQLKRWLPWVTRAEVHDDVLYVEHTYPEGVSISGQVRSFIKAHADPNQPTVEFVLERVDP